MSSLIPLSEDLAELIGENAEGVENRSLLIDKFAVPKNWIGSKIKRDDANRWSLMRLTDEGRTILREAGQEANRKAKKGGYSKNADNARYAANVLPELAKTCGEAKDTQSLRSQHSRRMLSLVRSMPEGHSATICAKLESRLAINLSEGIIENGGISLDRLFGLPLIPGSAVKGCARHSALAELAQAKIEEAPDLKDRLQRFVRVFGCCGYDFDGKKPSLQPYGHKEDAGISKNEGDIKGGVTFLPAAPLIDSKIEVDITNVHTPDYYVGKNTAGKLESLKQERPRPNVFPVVAPKTIFGFFIVLNNIGLRSNNPKQLLADAHRWLIEALTIYGIGAKTSSGYGWFSIDESFKLQLEEEMQCEVEKKEREQSEKQNREKAELEEKKRIAQLSPEGKAKEMFDSMDNQEFATAVNLIADKSEIEQQVLIQILKDSRKERWKKWKKSNKDTDKKRVETVRNIAQTLNIELP